jgi:hypothetical protein
MTNDKIEVKNPANADNVHTMEVISKNQFMGNLEAYVLGDNFDQYMALANNFFGLNGIVSDQKKVQLRINQIGTAAACKILKAIKPKLINDINFDELVRVCKSTFTVETNTIVEHFKFNAREQQDGEK